MIKDWILISRSKHPYWYHMGFYILQLIQSVIGLSTLGFVYVNICLPYSRWYSGYTIRQIQKKRKQNEI